MTTILDLSFSLYGKTEVHCNYTNHFFEKNVFLRIHVCEMQATLWQRMSVHVSRQEVEASLMMKESLVKTPKQTNADCLANNIFDRLLLF